MTRRLWFSCIALLGVLVVGLTYTMVVLIQVDPLHPPYRLRLDLPYSGGLLERANVSLRGTVVGRVESVELDDDEGVKVGLLIEDQVELPEDTDIVVGALSVAGEQYVDFRPRQATGPYLSDGDVVRPHRLTIPVPFSELLSHLVTFANDLDPVDIATLGRELAAATGGSGEELRRLFAHAESLMGTLEASWPDTRGILDHGDRALAMVDAMDDDLREIASSSRVLARELRRSDPHLRTILSDGPPTLAGALGLAEQLDAPTRELIGSAETLMGILSPRAPALGEFFPSLAYAADRAARVVSNNSIAILADIIDGPTCDYGMPTRSVMIGGKPGPYLYAYCRDYAPGLLERGPYYAPRPPGDDTDQAPPGVDRNERAGPRP